MLPYKRQFQAAVTFEIDPDKHEVRKIEYTLFEYLSAIGGLSSIFMSISQTLGHLDDAQVYVTSAMVSDEDGRKDRDGDNKISEVDDQADANSLRRQSTYSP